MLSDRFNEINVYKNKNIRRVQLGNWPDFFSNSPELIAKMIFSLLQLQSQQWQDESDLLKCLQANLSAGCKRLFRYIKSSDDIRNSLLC